MNAYVNPVKLGQSATDQLREDGYLKLEGLFTPTAVEGLRALLAEQLTQGVDRTNNPLTAATGGGQFARYSNNVDLSGDLMASVRESEEFRGLCRGLDAGEWLLTQGLGFEIQPGQKGLQWHFGFRSFCFIRPEDQGYTLWIPLDPVDPGRQNGGLPVVSERVYSGVEETKLLANYCADQDDIELLSIAGRNVAGFSALRNGILDKHRVEHAFAPGDALLFNRYVFHRSAEFLDGAQTRRRAFVTRLIPASARFDPDLFERSTALFKKFGMHTHEDPVADRLTDIAAGDPIGRSKFVERLF